MHDSGNTDSGSTFGEKLRAAGERHGRLCVGIDPHKSLLESWGFETPSRDWPRSVPSVWMPSLAM